MIQGIPQFTCLKCLETSIIIMCAPCFWIFWNCSSFCASSQNQTQTWKLDLRKNRLLGKTGPQGLKMLSFFSSNMKDYVEFIHFHVKSRGRFRANNVWKLHPKFLFWKQRNWYKKDDCQFASLICMERFCMFTHFHAASF